LPPIVTADHCCPAAPEGGLAYFKQQKIDEGLPGMCPAPNACLGLLTKTAGIWVKSACGKSRL